MPQKVNKKSINERSERMDNAWTEGAPTAEFMGIKQADLRGQITAVRAKEQTRADLQAQINILDDEINDLYIALDDTTVSVGNGVRGDKDFGDDSPLYGAMGFVRKSDRASGLTRKAKTPAK